MEDHIEPLRERRDLGLFVKRLFVGLIPLVIIVGAFGAMFAMGAFKPTPEEKEDPVSALPVLVAQAEHRDVKLSVETQGEVKPRIAVSLVPEVAGKISYVSPTFIEGGAFRKGDVLLSVNPEEYRLRVVQAKSNVAQAKTRLQNEQAEAEIAKEAAEELEIGQNSPLALREPQVAEATALLNSAEATLEEAELQLSRTEIRAPFDGRVRAKTVDVGAYVTPGAPMGEIFSVQVMQVRLPLTDDQLGQLNLDVGFMETATTPGPEVELTGIVAGKQHIWHGRIVRTESEYDAKTRVLFAYAEVEDPYGRGSDNGTPLASGLFVDARIEGASIANALVIPRTGLRGNDKVFVVRDDETIEIRPVTIASTNREEAIIIAGLETTERVIVSPVRGAADGMKIEIVERENAPDDAAVPEASETEDEQLASSTQTASN